MLAFAACTAHAEIVPLPAINGSVGLADLASAHDRAGWRLGIVRTSFPATSFGWIQADASEDEYALDCAGRTYAYARRTLLLANVVVRNVAIPQDKWSSQRFATPPAGSIPALALERFCALKDVPAK